MLESLVGVYLIRRFFGQSFTFKRLRDTLGFIIFVGLGATAVSATIGVASLWMTGTILTAHIPATWIAWWVGDTLGALIIAPFIIVWFTDPQREHATESYVEAIALAGTIVVANVIVFF